jgi:hypothetical protein
MVEARRLGDQAKALRGAAPPFSDVSSSHWASGYIQVAIEMGMIAGYPDGTFGPDRPITRAELVVMVVRALGWEKEELLGTVSSIPYDDAASIPGWAADAVGLAVKEGLLQGFATDRFSPSQLATRAEAALLMKGVLEVRNTLYDLHGFVYGTGSSSVELMVGEDPVELSFPSNVEVFRAAARIEASQIGMLQELGIVLSSGKPAYVDVYEAHTTGTIERIQPTTGEIWVTAPGHAIPTVYTVAADARIFRNGVPVSLNALQSDDSAYLVFSTICQNLAFIDSTHFDVEGEVVSASPNDSTVTVESTGGSEVTIQLTDATLVFVDGEAASIEDIDSGDQFSCAYAEGYSAAYVEVRRGGSEQ